MSTGLRSDRITRREALRRAGGLAVASVAAPGFADALPDQPGIIDAHIHLYAADQQRFPYHSRGQSVPDYVSTIEQWLADREGTGISHAVFIQGSAYWDDHRYFQHCLEVGAGRMLGVVLLNADLPGSPGRVEELARTPHVVGVRIHSAYSNVPQWGSRNVEAYWEKVGELDLVIGLHITPQYSRDLERMVRKYPGVRVVIDHLGRPARGTPIDYAVMLGLAAYPNVYMKISDLTAHSERARPHEAVVPLVKRIADAFTPARMVWGSNVYRGSMGSAAYAETVAIGEQVLSFLTTEERRQVFTESARRLYKL